MSLRETGGVGVDCDTMNIPAALMRGDNDGDSPKSKSMELSWSKGMIIVVSSPVKCKEEKNAR